MQNQQKKTLRHFQCRDFLWEIFEQMGGELECSIDYLINEAMRQYARSRNYGPRTSSMAMPAVGIPTTGSLLPPPPKPGAGPPPKPVAPQTAPTARPSVPPPRPPTTGPLSGPTTAPTAAPTAPTTSPKTNPRASAPNMAAVAPSVTPNTKTRTRSTPPPAPPSVPPQLPPRPSVSGGGTTLHIIFAGQKMPLLKDPFVIGRGSKTSDLAIKDGNISRKHAVVVRHEGAFYMKDLGSTNGVLWNGRRIESKRIEEGDVFHICDYELRFTYK